uniref:Uncharacterized protein n=1 Tax=Aplanochytrium stocchinoi TaxID=215587 RepID=A0A7S3LR92_9STRA|mmetsp:Transcript_19549/g.23762  ORF Transcript_19549/g.23762 Transcript_19549/m.23762 type:complete len:116 (-) Transcript_19549:66-413(-)|eukprot:CAMPEP_0204858316 /NCGR_PEP_ID=MMETSP1347-20130617/22264_1 /ASSEMBLY_ACC=CAM_ASM_000690 /TAXON_ID=215587 /ORGANISM="Aplanochytrium stocchinoi, Strain GSBS06" /LENGTH=115 /DNA_ID=CAMNT_0052006295 /DNA_START=30 /DNA_END=374 /DNA_ORIENTATION=+
MANNESSPSYKDAEVLHKANVYHGGKVTSRVVITKENERLTLGVMLPGTYNFGTEAAEIMDCTVGSCRVKLAGQSEWKTYKEGESFNVPANSRFDIEVAGPYLDYICHYIKDSTL